MGRFQVICGNLGTVYNGGNKFDAKVAYNTYRGKSIRGEGRVAGESVILMDGDDIIAETEESSHIIDCNDGVSDAL